ncbi:hypothetical protein N7471_001658 [Penicillium samsonianum]|uniref:uncharacterized protein n=1 Tax=Penicillium samsonianum TaxID=1882272 RepID=UPI002546A093|nr:uncharacterized protein N7471_001658 [Penicillium samsonianum]KAJ6150459.1 hypothetical protein N7471_001658 [Penicillium samsonianum]
MLSARPDYGIWHGDYEGALGYMGCIHRERNALPKRDCTVYGMASNGLTFSFLKISNDSKWSEHVVSVRDGRFEAPLCLLVNMVR